MSYTVNIKLAVRRRYPNAEVKPVGLTMFVVTDGEEELGPREFEPEDAWVGVYKLLKANGS